MLLKEVGASSERKRTVVALVARPAGTPCPGTEQFACARRSPSTNQVSPINEYLLIDQRETKLHLYTLFIEVECRRPLRPHTGRRIAKLVHHDDQISTDAQRDHISNDGHQAYPGHLRQRGANVAQNRPNVI